MSQPLALPIRLFSQPTRQTISTQCLRQRTGYVPLNSTSIKHQWHQRKPSTRRAFATSPKCHGPRPPSIRQPAQPSVARMQREQQAAMVAAGKLPDDVGLLQDTFILPRASSDRWSWRLRKKWLKTRLTEIYSAFAYKFVVKPRPKLELSTIAPLAAKLHEQMYKDFAAGNLPAMQNDVCTGLFGSLRARVLQRKPNTFLRWSVKKHLSAPKLCSYKAAVLPGGKGELNTERNSQIQAVVRLHTLQSLQHVQKVSKREGVKGAAVVREENMGPEEEKESVEYIVVQRSMRKGKLNPWQVWGFTNETTLEGIERAEASQ